MNDYKERLDKLIAAKKAWYQATCEFEIEDELETVETVCHENQIHVYRGIELLAEAVGCKLTHSFNNRLGNMLSFDYQGAHVFQLVDKEE